MYLGKGIKTNEKETFSKGTKQTLCTLGAEGTPTTYKRGSIPSTEEDILLVRKNAFSEDGRQKEHTGMGP